MKAKLLSKYSFEQVQSYWKRINAPVCIRRCPCNTDFVSVILRPGCSSADGNAFLIASCDYSVFDRDVIYRKLGRKSPVLDPVVVFESLHGKML